MEHSGFWADERPLVEHKDCLRNRKQFWCIFLLPWCNEVQDTNSKKDDVCELDVMTKHDFTLFLFFSAVASATFSDEQEFCESESCNERDFDKSHFYSNVKYCGEIPLTLSHKLIGKIQMSICYFTRWLWFNRVLCVLQTLSLLMRLKVILFVLWRDVCFQSLSPPLWKSPWHWLLCHRWINPSNHHHLQKTCASLQ